jgi:hypothetical protein
VAAALLCLFIALCAALILPGDPWADVALAQLLGHDTRYAAGYSESGWRKLRRGMTTREVEAILGPALKKIHYERDHEIWSYTDSPRGSDYWRRAVSFRGDVADEFVGGFYLD